MTKTVTLEEFGGQPWLRLPVEGLDVRFFLRGAKLDKGLGKAAPSRAALSPVLGDFGDSLRLIAPRQVHGTKIFDIASVLDTSAASAMIDNVMNAEGDGVLFDAHEALELKVSKGLRVEASLRFADCAPVVVAPSRQWIESGNSPWVLMMHSGYKGTVQNIVEAGLSKVRARWGTAALDGAWAWVGPCIGGTNYPRDIEEWTQRGLEVFREANVNRCGGKQEKQEKQEKIFFDIAGELRLQLMDGGVAKEKITLSGVDTCERTDMCYSYRGGDEVSRMFLWCANPPSSNL